MTGGKGEKENNLAPGIGEVVRQRKGWPSGLMTCLPSFSYFSFNFPTATFKVCHQETVEEHKHAQVKKNAKTDKRKNT